MSIFGKHKHVRSIAVFTLISMCFLVSAGILSADTLVKGYSSKKVLQPGLVVALDGGSDAVKIAPANDPRHMYGVVIDPSESPVSLTQSGQQTFVSTNGKHLVLVTNDKGAIKSGDYLSMSYLDGIAGKASPDQSYVLGRAAENFDGKNKVLANVAGVKVGKITVDILPKGNPIKKTGIAAPESLRRVSESIAGNPVGTLKIYIALAVLVAASVIAGILISVSVRSGIVSIGRNPLSKKSIIRGLLQSIIMAILIFIIGLLGVYLLLKL
jgi:hypothetical protein